MKSSRLRLYLVTDSVPNIVDIVKDAAQGGVTMVQLREKALDTRRFIERAIRLKQVLEPYGIPLIINDRVDVALASNADGVHIGQSDMPYDMARAILGPDKIIGLSVENQEQVVQANGLDVDYIGVSPVFATPTKTDTAAPFGLEGLREAVRMSLHPTVAIGGIKEENAAEVISTGTDGIAVVSAIVYSDSPADAARRLAETIGL